MADNSIGQLISGLIGDLGHLVRQELRLAQAETSEKLQQAQTGIYAVVTGLLIAFCALLILLQALVIALSEIMPAWAASLSVGVVLALVAFILIRQGSKRSEEHTSELQSLMRTSSAGFCLKKKTTTTSTPARSKPSTRNTSKHNQATQPITSP